MANRWSALIVCVFFLFLPQQAARSQSQRTNPGSKCGDQSLGLPNSYADAVFSQFEPPDWRGSLIRIGISGPSRLDLWTDGQNFKLWTYEVTPPNVVKSLLDLDLSCRLPADPADAAAFFNVRWRSVELQPQRFAKLHRDFITAFSQDVSKAQRRYESMIETGLRVDHLDASGFQVVYDNSHEHFETWVWNDPEHAQDEPMLVWLGQIQKVAEEYGLK